MYLGKFRVPPEELDSTGSTEIVLEYPQHDSLHLSDLLRIVRVVSDVDKVLNLWIVNLLVL